MKKMIGLAMLALLVAVPASAQVIPKGLIDSKPEQALLINLDQYYSKRQLPEKPSIDVDTIFTSPRSQVQLRTILKGFTAGAHYHSTADEIVIVVGGSGELFLNGQWVAVKQGDVHVNPRGVVHDTRALNENMRFLSIYTPQLPPGGDANMVK
ncbi:MAG: cupin domain-containing protein [Desulfovibrio sp.]|nr:cupin domain-containing protein [Desulfovibrio sp.]